MSRIRKRLWLYSRLVFLALALSMVVGFGDGLSFKSVRAEACNTGSGCEPTRNGYACVCQDTGCDGCFVKNGEANCGHCAKAPGGGGELE